MATTDAKGNFAFSEVPGTYMLIVGSNSASDMRATLHEKIVLIAGSNALGAATPQPAPDVTPLPSQSAGALRLMALSSVQQNCLTGANQGRTQDALPLLVPDEYLEEDAVSDAVEQVAQTTDTPSPLFGYSQPFGTVNGITTEVNFSTCSSWTGPAYSYVSGNPPYGSATNALDIWYGANFVPNPAQQYGTFGAQLWNTDPR